MPELRRDVVENEEFIPRDRTGPGVRRTPDDFKVGPLGRASPSDRGSRSVALHGHGLSITSQR